MFSLATVTWFPSSSAICSRAGAICLQGPHHSAQKSTSTGKSACRTTFSKDSSVTLTLLMFTLRIDPPAGEHLGQHRPVDRHLPQIGRIGGLDGGGRGPVGLEVDHQHAVGK